MEKQTSKRSVVIAGIALALVLVGGAAAYGVLAGRQGDAAAASTQTASSATDSGTSSQEMPAQQTSSSDSSASVGMDAPRLADYDATVYTSEGEAITLSQIANGKPLVINFWATWCPYCVQEFPDYKTLLSEYGDSVSFAFVDAPGSKGETVQKAQEWLAQNGYEDFPAYYDNDLEASINFGARSLPTTVVVAADGEIQGASAGAIDLQRMRTALYALTHQE